MPRPWDVGRVIAIETVPLIEPPPVGLMVMVDCGGFCCLAYRNAEGKWMSVLTHEELDSVVRVLPV